MARKSELLKENLEDSVIAVQRKVKLKRFLRCLHAESGTC